MALFERLPPGVMNETLRQLRERGAAQKNPFFNRGPPNARQPLRVIQQQAVPYLLPVPQQQPVVPKNKDANGFDIKIIPAGTVLYKGLRAGPNVSCRTLKDTSMFYLTENPEIARHYSTNYLCKFTSKKPLKLFVLNRENVGKLLQMSIFTKAEAESISFATGVGFTKIQQRNYLFKRYGGGPAFVRFMNSNFGRRLNAGVLAAPNSMGARASLYNTNKEAFSVICKKFFGPKGYDGYYAYQKTTPYHRNKTGMLGEFHSEMMICNASKKIIRVSETKKIPGGNQNIPLFNTPLATNQNIQDAIPRIFIEFVKINKIPYNFVDKRFTYLTGGMAVRVLTNNVALNNTIKNKVENTNDFDFTVATPRQYTPAYLQAAIKKTREVFDPYLTNFVNTLNAYYPSVSTSTLEIIPKRVFSNGKIQNNLTGRTLYTVISYNIKTGSKTIDLADVAICWVPGIDETWIDKTTTNSKGFPVLKHNYLLKDIGILLAKSFFSRNKFNTKRNPLTGSSKEKGEKNMYRLSALCSVKYNSPCKKMSKLFNNVITQRNVTLAKKNAEQLYNELKRY
jgi:hypothetical protein